jgi:hypothetical protein
MTNINTVIFPANSGEAVERALDALKGGYKPEDDPFRYPRGPTGEKGTWKRYFSGGNRRLYNKVCDAFVTAHPYGRLIQDLYPDLLLPES